MTDDDAPASLEKGERIAKRIARSGLCSRRDAERWIAEGRVVVDGHKLASPAHLVTEASTIVVDGKPLRAAQATRLWRYHKPRGLITTHRDPQGRPTIFERLPADLPRVISIGRLDFNSEGLLLLTNDGALARRLELPATGWLRRYRVRVHGELDAARLEKLADGIEIDGVRYGAIQATLDSRKGSNAWLTLSLREGKNREVRRVIEALGGEVTRLIRIAYGPFQLGYLAESAAEEVAARVMREQLGSGDGSTSARKRGALRERADRRR
ncbi:MAG: rRNA pseudouridine synthase [Proteobacteria bacterium]|nr:rRNA pseudouridine synthase [Pseudomonadota bacterium]